MGLLDNIKQEVQKSGTNKGKFLYIKDGDKKRIRFLQEIDDGVEIIFHDSFAKGVNVPCQTIFGRECSNCDEEDMRTRPQYAWSVYDYDTNEVKILMYPVNSTTPITQLVDLATTLGSITNRDLIVKATGKAQNRSFSVINGEKSVFKNKKAKPLTKKAILKIIDKAYPCDDVEEDIEDKYGNDSDYDDMSVKELYQECIKRGLEVEKKKKAKYYINELIDDDNAKDDWDDEDSDEVDYEEMKPQELYLLCKERDIKCKPKQKKNVYIELLEEYDDEQESDDGDWDEDSEEDDDDEWED